MSDVSQGPGWWLASDGRWYPPYALPSQSLPHSPLAASPGSTSSRRPRIWPAITALTVGTVCAFVGLLLFALGFAGVDGPVHQAPVTVSIECHVGDYYVYQRVGYQVSGPGFSYFQSGVPTLRPYQVIVRAPDGARTATWATDASESINRGSWSFASSVGFHASRAGKYEVQIARVTPSAVIVAPSLGSAFVRAAKWLILVGVGGPLAVAGLVVLIVALVRRGRQNRIPAYYGGPPNPWGAPTFGR